MAAPILGSPTRFDRLVGGDLFDQVRVRQTEWRFPIAKDRDPPAGPMKTKTAGVVEDLRRLVEAAFGNGAAGEPEGFAPLSARLGASPCPDWPGRWRFQHLEQLHLLLDQLPLVVRGSGLRQHPADRTNANAKPRTQHLTSPYHSTVRRIIHQPYRLNKAARCRVFTRAGGAQAVLGGPRMPVRSRPARSGGADGAPRPFRAGALALRFRWRKRQGSTWGQFDQPVVGDELHRRFQAAGWRHQAHRLVGAGGAHVGQLFALDRLTTRSFLAAVDADNHAS